MIDPSEWNLTPEQSARYRSDLAQLKEADPTNEWRWQLDRLAPLEAPVWSCVVPVTDSSVTFQLAVFRNPLRDDRWEIVPIYPAPEKYPDSAPIVMESIGDAGDVPVIEPAPPADATLPALRTLIERWVDRALRDEVHLA